MEPKHISCYGCKNDLGGGFCRINLEKECGAGEFEAYEAVSGTESEGHDEHEKCIEAEEELRVWMRYTRIAIIVWSLFTLVAIIGAYIKCSWLAALFSVYTWVCGWSIRGFIEEINRTHRRL